MAIGQKSRLYYTRTDCIVLQVGTRVHCRELTFVSLFAWTLSPLSDRRLDCGTPFSLSMGASSHSSAYLPHLAISVVQALDCDPQHVQNGAVDVKPPASNWTRYQFLKSCCRNREGVRGNRMTCPPLRTKSQSRPESVTPRQRTFSSGPPADFPHSQAFVDIAYGELTRGRCATRIYQSTSHHRDSLRRLSGPILVREARWAYIPPLRPFHQGLGRTLASDSCSMRA